MPAGARKKPWELSDSHSDDSDDGDDVLNLTLGLFLNQAKRASRWAYEERPPTPEEAKNPADPHWSAAARGVEIRNVSHAVGDGAFATKEFPIGSLVGVYEGERLSMKDFSDKHKAKQGGEFPWTGEYCFSLLPPTDELEEKALRAAGFSGDDEDDEYVACKRVNNLRPGTLACLAQTTVDILTCAPRHAQTSMERIQALPRGAALSITPPRARPPATWSPRWMRRSA